MRLSSWSSLILLVGIAACGSDPSVSGSPGPKFDGGSEAGAGPDDDGGPGPVIIGDGGNGEGGAGGTSNEATCGDFDVQGDEECDDGDDDPGDGCDDACQIEEN